MARRCSASVSLAIWIALGWPIKDKKKIQLQYYPLGIVVDSYSYAIEDGYEVDIVTGQRV